MEVSEVIIIGMALAMDAFGISMGIGINGNINRKEKKQYIILFGFFQFLFLFIGGIGGYYFDNYIVGISKNFGAIVIMGVGLLMIIDGLKAEKTMKLDKGAIKVLLSISVSIDALVVGFATMNHLGSTINLFINGVLVGFITILLCTIAFIICRVIKKIGLVTKYADYIGGVALIAFGIKMLLT